MIDHLNVTIQNTHAQLQQSLQQLVAEGTVTVQPDTMATQQYPVATPIQSHQAPLPVVQQYYTSPVPPNDMVARKQVCVFRLIRNSSWQPWSLIDQDIFEFFSEALVFSSPEPKARVSYCHSAPSLVRPSVRKLFTFSTSSPEPLDGF